MNASSGSSAQRAESNSDFDDVVSLRSQLKRMTKERLIASAVELFSARGYRATTVADIAKAAGTTPTTFYRYFPGKSDIARLLQDRINIDVQQTLTALDEVRRPGRQSIRAWVDQYGQMWQRIHVLCNAYWEATSTDPELAAELVPVTYKLTGAMKLLGSLPNNKTREKVQTRLVLLYLLMDRLLYLVNIQGRTASALKMLDEFAEIFYESIYGSIEK